MSPDHRWKLPVECFSYAAVRRSRVVPFASTGM
jgi:hypothetical protein